MVALLARLDASFARACAICLDCRGRVVVIGMGKSGHIGRKIAATLASTGTPAFFVHPAEASHGDLGMITRDDVVLAHLQLRRNRRSAAADPAPVKRLGVPLIAMTGNAEVDAWRAPPSSHLDVASPRKPARSISRPPPAPPPRSRMGDALAVALLEARGFTPQDFARSHPGGALGRKLLMHVATSCAPATPCRGSARSARSPRA